MRIALVAASNTQHRCRPQRSSNCQTEPAAAIVRGSRVKPVNRSAQNDTSSSLPISGSKNRADRVHDAAVKIVLDDESIDDRSRQECVTAHLPLAAMQV